MIENLFSATQLFQQASPGDLKIVVENVSSSGAVRGTRLTISSDGYRGEIGSNEFKFLSLRAVRTVSFSD
jgi:hypothetical protein